MTTLATPRIEVAPEATRDAWSERMKAEGCSIASAEGAWRAFERDAVMTPYGRYDWASAMSAADDEHARAVLVRDCADRLLAILPLVVARRAGLTVASSLGGKHANYTLPLLRPDLLDRLSPAAARAMLATAARALGADAISLSNVPVLWDGRPNPFAALGRPSASTASSLRLSGDGEDTLARSMSNDARKKARNKLRGLEKIGPVILREAADAADVDAILGAFFEQKAARFQELGLPDPFADTDIRRSLRSGALVGLERGEAAIELYALEVDGRIVAVLGGAADSRRLSGMFLSFAAGPEARFSPGEALVTAVIRRQCERGREVFDLGVGEARYKTSICNIVDELVDVDLAVSWSGRGYVALREAALGAKRRIKSSPRAMTAVGWVRRRLAGLRG